MECSVITTLIDLALMYGLLSYHLSILSQAQQGWRYIRLSGGSHSAKYFSKWNYHQALGKPYKSWEQTWHSPLPSPLTTTTGIVTAPTNTTTPMSPVSCCRMIWWKDPTHFLSVRVVLVLTLLRLETGQTETGMRKAEETDRTHLCRSTADLFFMMTLQPTEQTTPSSSIFPRITR